MYMYMYTASAANAIVNVNSHQYGVPGVVSFYFPTNPFDDSAACVPPPTPTELLILNAPTQPLFHFWHATPLVSFHPLNLIQIIFNGM